MSQRDTLVHLFAGGLFLLWTLYGDWHLTFIVTTTTDRTQFIFQSPTCGGTVGAILTCPLEVVKTRLQSSHVTFYISEVQLSTVNGASVARMAPPGPLHCLKLILEKEGPRSLFRGLGPNLVGVAPSRAIYFASYSTAKEKLSGVFEPDSTQVHMVSAGLAERHTVPDKT
uniref:Solute carrier family 25 member 36a n=1 Tax=Salmo trutta TaxID=8032 RepID=A0A674E5C3_SALTR